MTPPPAKEATKAEPVDVREVSVLTVIEVPVLSTDDAFNVELSTIYV
jgi:hypothetical protein